MIPGVLSDIWTPSTLDFTWSWLLVKIAAKSALICNLFSICEWSDHSWIPFDLQVSNKRVVMVLFCFLTAVSEAPKAAPIARKYDSRYELEEVKTTEQQKEDVNVLIPFCLKSACLIMMVKQKTVNNGHSLIVWYWIDKNSRPKICPRKFCFIFAKDQINCTADVLFNRVCFLIQ